MSNPLAQAAKAAGLEVCSRIIGGYAPGLPAAADADASLLLPAPRSVAEILGQLVRRGLQPSLVAALREQWADRPLERALLSWDVLNGALLPDALAAELRDEARLVGAVLPEAGVAAVLRRPDEIEQLIAAIAVPSLEQRSSDPTSSTDPVLGVLRVAGVVPDTKLLDLIRQYARVLALAHLPTLASFWLADLFVHHRYQPALRDLLETLLDENAGGAEEWIAGDTDSVELATYARLRVLNEREQWDAALTFAATHPAAQTESRSRLAYAEALLRAGRPALPLEDVAALTNVDLPWRYAFRVLLTYSAARIKDPSFVTLLAMYIEKLGNHWRAWYDSMAVAPADVRWGPRFPALLAREALSLPHDPHVWKAAVLLLGEDDASDGVDEVDVRLRAQAKLT